MERDSRDRDDRDPRQQQHVDTHITITVEIPALERWLARQNQQDADQQRKIDELTAKLNQSTTGLEASVNKEK